MKTKNEIKKWWRMSCEHWMNTKYLEKYLVPVTTPC